MHTEREVKEMKRKNWLVIVNTKCSIKGGNRKRFDSRSSAIADASFIANVLYNACANSHVFVVEEEEIEDIESNDLDELKYKVKYHYSVICDKLLKMILFYEGYSDKRRKIASQWIGEEDK